MLQGLEEELNRHTTEEVHMENNFIPDYTMDPEDMEEIIQDELYQKAKEWWRSYKALNDCYITDELYGEICNQIQCPQCKKVVSAHFIWHSQYITSSAHTTIPPSTLSMFPSKRVPPPSASHSSFNNM